MLRLNTRAHAFAARLRLVVRGAVQGVGFRPFVYRLAKALGLAGWINNSAQGVIIEVEGRRVELEEFLLRLHAEKPARSFIQSCEATWLDVTGFEGFEIHASEDSGSKTAFVLPDTATCPDCLREIFDPANRRYRYPFTNCTHCGPRFSIIEALPYDRANTSMRSFMMCSACQAEYDDPRDRRFHAQPNACPVCGPRLEFWNAAGIATSASHAALLAAAAAIRRGQIVAVKGIGGFHLIVDARNAAAVRRLRERKQREEKPFALLFPTLESVQAVCEVSALEERLLRSPEAPIVLLRKLKARPHPGPLPQEREKRSPFSGKSEVLNCTRDVQVNKTHDSCPLSPGERAGVRVSVEQTSLEIAPSIAPGNPNLGVMLPSNPLHHLLMAELGFPVVATSGNLSDEPIQTDEFEAFRHLQKIADAYLVNNRPIVRHVDDSIVRVMLDRQMIIRRARGYAPLPILVGTRSTASPFREKVGDAVERVPTVLAVGAHLKNSVALAVGDQVFLSQHIGDLETEQAHEAFRRVAADLPRLYDAHPEVVAADLHPDYLSTQFAMECRPPARRDSSDFQCAGSETGAPQVVRVQHHVAHVLSCIAENEVKLPALGVAWDGTGFGADGTTWGGEFFLVTKDTVERVAHWRPFRVPGGDAAAKEPRRAALGLFHELAKSGNNLLLHTQQKLGAMFSPVELAALKTALVRGLNSPWSCSVGRLFDAVAALVGLRQQMRFEGQAAMELEFAAEAFVTDATYEVMIADSQSPTINLKSEIGNPKSEMVLDWARMIEGILADVARGVAVAEISAKFHNTLAEAIVSVAKRMDCPRVALSGGCFQNRYLTERTVRRLREDGFQPYWHQRVPPNDGGIALGQVVAARRELTRRSAAFTPLHPPQDESLGYSDGSQQTVSKRAEARAPYAPPSADYISRITHHASP